MNKWAINNNDDDDNDDYDDIREVKRELLPTSVQSQNLFDSRVNYV